MKETFRWFGPEDPVPLDHIRQTGATGIVTALHHIYRGEAWPVEEVFKRKAEIEASGLEWSVVESIPVHPSIKLRSKGYSVYIDAWKASLVAVAAAGIPLVCYNFIPVADCTRTDLMWKLPSTGYALRFDLLDFAAYDLFILARRDAEASYSSQQVGDARMRFDSMCEARRRGLEHAIVSGLPGAEASYDREVLCDFLSAYSGMTHSDLQSNLFAFLKEIVPVAEALGVRLAIHPDDPPLPLFGVPRVVSTAADARALLATCDTMANGLTFCVGSYGVRADNDLVAMIDEFADRIHFAHLRQVMREPDGSFYEAEHLEGSSDMLGLIDALLREESRRRNCGRKDHEMPMRPDHGHLLGDEIHKRTNPGYSMIGRLKGLAELRGAIRGLEYARVR